MPSLRTRVLVVLLCLGALLVMPRWASAEEALAGKVRESIEKAKRFLVSKQNNDGSWTAGEGANYRVGVTSLATLALINAGMTMEDDAVRRGVGYLRGIGGGEPTMTYEISLMISALAAAKDGQRDTLRIAQLAAMLEKGQFKEGDGAGSWSYNVTGDILGLSPDRSNGQFAVLGLYEAANAGVQINRQTWERARDHWLRSQSGDGGWGYSGSHNPGSTGSMTVAGISTLVITDLMLANEQDFGPDGQPICCPEYEPNDALEKAVRWMDRNFKVDTNPGSSGAWLLYYLYGLERAGRLSGMRFFGERDWYRRGAEFLVEQQSQRFGSWQGTTGMERDPVIGTSFSLLFLSKGLAPVLINKLKYGPPDPMNRLEVAGDNWNKHRKDVRNLTELISGLPKWPKLVTWQVVDLLKLRPQEGVQDLLQSPILYISGKDAPQLTAEQVEMLRMYVDQGGFIFAVPNCSGTFGDGFRALVQRMYPGGEAELKRLGADHPIYRAEYLLDPDAVELYGVDFGCRTPIVYCPDDISCFWEKWARYDPPRRTPEMKSMITRATRIGINVVAYATGREPFQKLERPEQIAEDGPQDRVTRGLLEIAKLRHTGGWDAAPRALRNLLVVLNETVGLSASTKKKDLTATDPSLFKYPLVYMHGRNSFQMNRQERERLKMYLERGGVLFADAACGSRQFDESFRNLMAELFSNKEFKRIPASHEMFTSDIGYDIRRVKRRAPEANNPDAALNTIVQEGEPFLEGIEIDGRYAVIYSKFDISCVLERQASVACIGYVPEDAVKIAINVVLYAMLQDVSWKEHIK